MSLVSKVQSYFDEPLSDAQAHKFNRWQGRTILMCIVGYAFFYLVRKNISIAIPYLQEDLGITKSQIGLILTIHGVVYGFSKYINGIWSDRSNARVFLTLGLITCAFCNIFFGFSSSLFALGVFWILNGWFQGMGNGPCTKLLAYWVPPHQLATKQSWWNTSHSIGAGIAAILCGYLIVLNWHGIGAWLEPFVGSEIATTMGNTASWRWTFFIPGILVLIGAGLVWTFIRDTPTSVGLPEMANVKKIIPKEHTVESKKEHRDFVMKHVYKNPVIWIISAANFFLYTVRFAVLDWGPTMLKEHLNIDIQSAGWTVAGFEIAGVVGMIVMGYLTDKWFGGRGPRISVFCLAFVGLCMGAFFLLDSSSPVWLASTLLILAGFFIYGPQALVGITASNHATSRAAATAGGFCGIFAYASTVVSGYGIGYLVEQTGWNVALGALIAVSFICSAIFALAWNAKAHNYEE